MCHVQEELAASQAQLRRTELRAEAADHARTLASQQHDKLIQENMTCQTQMSVMRDALTQHDVRVEEERRNKTSCAAQMVEMKRVTTAQAAAMQEMTREQQMLRDRIVTLERALRETTTRADDATHEHERVRVDMTRLQQEHVIIDASQRQMRKDYAMATEQQHELEKQVAALKEKATKVAKERVCTRHHAMIAHVVIDCAVFVWLLYPCPC